MARERLSTELPKLMCDRQRAVKGSGQSMIDADRPFSICKISSAQLPYGETTETIACERLLMIAVPGLSMSTSRRNVSYCCSAKKDKLCLLFITALATQSSFPCTPTRSGKYTVNSKTFFLC